MMLFFLQKFYSLYFMKICFAPVTFTLFSLFQMCFYKSYNTTCFFGNITVKTLPLPYSDLTLIIPS